MPVNVRVPDELYKAIRLIRIALEEEYEFKTPSFQDFINVALERLLREWEDPNTREQILQELLTRRQQARMRMGTPQNSSQ